MTNVRSGAILLKIQRDQYGAKAKSGKEMVFSCRVYDRPQTFDMANEDEEEILKQVKGRNHWFFFELDKEPRKGTGRPITILEDVRISVSVENPYIGLKVVEVLSTSTVISPSRKSRRETVVLDGGRVAIRISQSEDSWFVMGVRIAIPNEIKEQENKKDRKISLPVINKPRRHSKVLEDHYDRSDEPEEPPPPTFEPGVLGWDVFPTEGLRVTLRDDFRNDLDTGRGFGTVTWLCEPEGDMNKGDTCRVLWDKTGLRRVYKTGYQGQFELRAVDEDNADAPPGNQSRAQLEARAKARTVQERLQREARKHGQRLHHAIGGLDAIAPLLRECVRTPSPRREDFPAVMKACFATPMADRYPPLPTPYLQLPRRAAAPPTRSGRGGSGRKVRVPRVAIVGGGVAALACAQHLVPLGYKVTVFEARPEHGGRLGLSSLGGRAVSVGCCFFTAASRAFREQVGRLHAPGAPRRRFPRPVRSECGLLRRRGHVGGRGAEPCPPGQGSDWLP